ncbi:recombinase family protein [Paraburkholderia tropica]|uniref:recombinase family protein n=1 Tax=Paraburkholderia tropica TaxID=92647 RepID=UPI0017B75F7F|nr:recombinase family protein [Paraburkholderia tropica]MBB2984564.1 DNA invertase Pin-like site-specific DNA recombinase [Paraburkholderia tropica]
MRPNVRAPAIVYQAVKESEASRKKPPFRNGGFLFLCKRCGCRKVFAEKITGTRRARPQLDRMVDHLRAGDVIVVTRLDRLARSIRDLLDIVERIRDAGAGPCNLAEPWADTTTPAGRMVLTVFGGMAEFERSLIVGRTSSGRAAAMARGTKFGRKPSLSPTQLDHIYRLADEGNSSMQEIAELFGIPPINAVSAALAACRARLMRVHGRRRYDACHEVT